MTLHGTEDYWEDAMSLVGLEDMLIHPQSKAVPMRVPEGFILRQLRAAHRSAQVDPRGIDPTPLGFKRRWWQWSRAPTGNTGMTR